MTIKIGDFAPEIDARSDDGRSVKLSTLRGAWVVLYFYPRASSLGCSVEAARFQQALPEFERLGAVVVGVSTDTEAAQAKFRETCDLRFPLLPDGDKTISRAYGVIGGLMGLLNMADRQTFLIDPEGRLVQHWRRVNPHKHAAEVLADLRRRVDVLSEPPAVRG
ncbi:peroxiredoxin [Deinococcus yavapaiensis]|uniref:thioredoxin-dependent peroxiredoxin n=1 Tax=Deinococcus yavapaiensis KR-236 TaxID=694435 RepID=A0A318SCA8_9DEIO|nr:peroxiredoxin [Deinococcus yavapaiensis]PYE54934.1 peroxiredoxin Q/BCP [Deinococcus yavapaiensis KR-236]